MSIFRTQRRSRTGTVSHWCLRPARLPIPPAGHFYFSKDFKYSLPTPDFKCFSLLRAAILSGYSSKHTKLKGEYGLVVLLYPYYDHPNDVEYHSSSLHKYNCG